MNIDINDIQADIQTELSAMAKTGSLDAKAILDEMLTIIEPIDFYEEGHIDQGKSLSKQVYTIVVVEKILEIAREKHWDLATENNRIFIYNGSQWIIVSADGFKRFLQKAATRMGVPDRYAKHFLFQDDLLRQFLSAADLPTPETQSSRVLINLQNGTFENNANEHCLREFRKEDFLTYQLPFSYDPEARCPIFHAFLDRNLPDKGCQDLIAEYIAYVLSPFLKLEKVLILYGEGANGKSVLFQIIKALLGEENVCSYSLQNLTAREGYQRAELGNKLLNYAPEINGRIDPALFKQLASGEPVEARFIFERAFILRKYARLLFNCNVLPSDVEMTHAFFRRFMIIPFTETIPEEEQDPDLARKITQNELPGIFNWVIEGLDRLTRNKRFTEPEMVREANKSFRDQSDSLTLFLEDSGIVAGSDHSAQVSALYARFSAYARSCNLPAISMKSFSEKMSKAGFEKIRTAQGRFFNYSLVSLSNEKIEETDDAV
ncbi:MAG: DNA primase [Bacteroidales bacterium]|nr:DNA primase [Bacteroidales bacterium]